jgi:hypothetical protein
MKTTTGTLMTKPTSTMAPQVMTVPEMMAAMAVMMMATLVWFLQSSAIDFQAPNGGSVSVDVSIR